MIKRLLPLLLLAAAAPSPLAIDGQRFAQGDVLDARGLPDVGGGASILVTLTPEAAQRLAALTHGRIGAKLTVTLDGVTIAEPELREELAGALQVSGDFTLAQAVAMAKRIAGKDPLPDDLEE